MPLFTCTKNGKSGWKFGKNNKTCFVGPDAKKRAIRQGIKILGPKKFREEMTKGEAKKEILDILNNDKELQPNEIEVLMLAADLSVNEVVAVFNERTKFLKKIKC